MEWLEHSLFFDIETAPLYAQYAELPEALRQQWDRRIRTFKTEADADTRPEVVYNAKAAVYAEFARVVCIAVGRFSGKGEQAVFRVKSFSGQAEDALLKSFCESLERFTRLSNSPVTLIGHNVREFDIPFLARRMLIHGLRPPVCLQVQGKKPWETRHIEDTMELWRFGDSRSYTPLALLAAVFGIPSPKDDIDGAQVGRVFWEDGDLRRIAAYCKKDVITTAKVYLRLKGEPDTDIRTEDLDA